MAIRMRKKALKMTGTGMARKMMRKRRYPVHHRRHRRW
jgi:hypothetical protein